MGGPAGCRILALIGSGETSPTMVTVHRDLVARLGLRCPRAVRSSSSWLSRATGPSALRAASPARSVAP